MRVKELLLCILCVLPAILIVTLTLVFVPSFSENERENKKTSGIVKVDFEEIVSPFDEIKEESEEKILNDVQDKESFTEDKEEITKEDDEEEIKEKFWGIIKLDGTIVFEDEMGEMPISNEFYEGDKVQILDELEDFYYIRVKGIEGYIDKNRVEKVNGLLD